MIELIKDRRRLLVVGAAAGAIALTALMVTPAQASNQALADEGPGYTVEPVGVPLDPGYTVENYIHPNADIIAAQTNILLKDGNGQIMYTTCNTADKTQIKVESKVRELADICFSTTGQPGWLKMEIPGSFGVRAGTKDVYVTINTQPDQIVVSPGKPKGIDPNYTNQVTLVELSVK